MTMRQQKRKYIKRNAWPNVWGRLDVVANITFWNKEVTSRVMAKGRKMMKGK